MMSVLNAIIAMCPTPTKAFSITRPRYSLYPTGHIGLSSHTHIHTHTHTRSKYLPSHLLAFSISFMGYLSDDPQGYSIQKGLQGPSRLTGHRSAGAKSSRYSHPILSTISHFCGELGLFFFYQGSSRVVLEDLGNGFCWACNCVRHSCEQRLS